MAKRKTAKELQADLDNTIKALETPETPETPPTSPEPSTPIPSEAAPSEPSSPVEPSTPAADEPDENDEIKSKLLASQQEGIVLHSKVKSIASAVKQAVNSPEPTEEELKTKYPEWDVMSETERMLAKDNLRHAKVIGNLIAVTKESEDIEAWNSKVNDYISDPKTLVNNPDLDGKQDEFKLFASKSTRRGVPFEDLTAAFLYDMSKKIKPNRGKMFETGVGGPNTPQKPKSDKISIEESIILKKNNYRKYKEMLLAGKIDTSSIQ